MKAIIVFLLAFVNLGVYAQWSSNPSINNAVCDFAGNQTNVQLISDGAGGAFLTWEDTRNSVRDIYAQRIDVNGSLLWNVDGIAICNAVSDQFSPRLVSDEAGGAIIAWYDNRSGNYDIYAQRMNANGTVQWTTDGVAICTATGNQNAHQLIADGSGGAIIVWSDGGVGGPNADIKAQRINASGTVLWTTDGVSVCNAFSLQNVPQLISDGAGGAIIAWEDWRNFSQADIYAQRISFNGFVSWTFNGVAICTESSYHQYNTKIVSDNAGGAIICWQDNRNFGSGQDIYAQKVNGSGLVQWVNNGVAVCNANALQTAQQIIADGTGGAILTWEDRRTGQSDIYAQRMSGSGAAQWAANGIAVCDAIAMQNEPQIVLRASGGALIIWTDLRNNSQEDIYAQAVTLAGTLLWPANGVPVANESHSQFTSQLISDGADGAIIAWQDLRTALDYDIYSSKLFANGTLPVKLISFMATMQNKNTLLQWQTADEHNVAKYNLQKSFKGNTFSTIISVNSKGISTESQNYSYTDNAINNPNTTKIYYRLQIVDRDGKITYSKTEVVKLYADLSIIIAPNPVKESLIVFLQHKIHTLSIINSKGQTCKTILIGGTTNQITFDLRQLTAGIYFIKADGENQVWTKQFVKE